MGVWALGQSVARLREAGERELRVLSDSRLSALEDALQSYKARNARLEEDFRYNLSVGGGGEHKPS